MFCVTSSHSAIRIVSYSLSGRRSLPWSVEKKTRRYSFARSFKLLFVPCHRRCRSSGSYGEALTDDELEWAVLCLEESEALMSAFDFSIAAGILENVLGRFVSIVVLSIIAHGSSASRLIRPSHLRLHFCLREFLRP